MVLFATVAQDFVRADQLATLEELKVRDGVVLIGLTQDENEEFRQLFDYFIVYGQPGSLNDGYHSLWYLSLLMSELLYEL